MTNQTIEFVDFNNEINTLKEEISRTYVGDGLQQIDFLFEIKEFATDEYEYDNVGIVIDLANKEITDVVLVDDAGGFDILTDEIKNYIKNAVKATEIFNYTSNGTELTYWELQIASSK